MEQEKKKGFLAEFKEFAARGSVLDLAVGVVIGGAFGKITSSLVDDIFMPLIGFLFGERDFSQWKLVLRPEIEETVGGLATGEILQPEISILIGSFLGVIINFILVAFAMFLFVKAINRMRAKPEEPEEPAEEEAPEPTAEELLLVEIRDLLKEGRHES